MDKSELILNKDGSVYHLKLKPENLSSTVILVGDPFRVDKVTKHFNNIEFKTQNREFKSVTGFYKSKRITVVSTGIGSSNIDIVLNELDALVNLNLVRIGTSGAIQNDVPVDSFLLSKMAIDIDGFMLNYDLSNIDNKSFTNYISEKHQIQDQLYCYDCSSELYNKFNSNDINRGITITCGRFYASHGRSIRLSASHKNNLSEIKKIKYKNYNATNLEMETAIIYAMSELLGHNAISLNAILANRNLEEYSVKPENTVENLIEYTLSKL